jgi:hypothetical protein
LTQSDLINYEHKIWPSIDLWPVHTKWLWTRLIRCLWKQFRCQIKVTSRQHIVSWFFWIFLNFYVEWMKGGSRFICDCSLDHRGRAFSRHFCQIWLYSQTFLQTWWMFVIYMLQFNLTTIIICTNLSCSQSSPVGGTRACVPYQDSETLDLHLNNSCVSLQSPGLLYISHIYQIGLYCKLFCNHGECLWFTCYNLTSLLK